MLAQALGTISETKRTLRQSSRTVTQIGSRPNAAIRLFAFPFAGGNTSIYTPWLQKIAPEIELCPIQLPGRSTRFAEPAFDTIERLLPYLLEEIKPYLDKPFAFFGHSMGGLISFEFTRYLRKLGYRLPQHLFISAYHAPQLTGRKQKPHRRPLYQLEDDAFVTRLSGYKGTPSEILQNRDLLDILMPMLRADFKLCETYRYQPEPPLNIPISAFRGTQDSLVTGRDMALWQHQTNSPLTLRAVHGDHFFLHKARTRLLLTIKNDLFAAHRVVRFAKSQ